jgi:hypothetical protein
MGPDPDSTPCLSMPGHPSVRVIWRSRRREIDDNWREAEGRALARRGGVGVIGVAIVFGLTTDRGGLDWVGITTAIAGVVMTFTGLFQALRGDTPHRA